MPASPFPSFVVKMVSINCNSTPANIATILFDFYYLSPLKMVRGGGVGNYYQKPASSFTNFVVKMKPIIYVSIF